MYGHLKKEIRHSIFKILSPLIDTMSSLLWAAVTKTHDGSEYLQHHPTAICMWCVFWVECTQTQMDTHKYTQLQWCLCELSALIDVLIYWLCEARFTYFCRGNDRCTWLRMCVCLTQCWPITSNRVVSNGFIHTSPTVQILRGSCVTLKDWPFI